PLATKQKQAVYLSLRPARRAAKYGAPQNRCQVSIYGFVYSRTMPSLVNAPRCIAFGSLQCRFASPPFSNEKITTSHSWWLWAKIGRECATQPFRNKHQAGIAPA